MLTAATWVSASLVIVAGARKIARPHPTGAALRAARLPSGPHLVRALGLGEIALGTTVLMVGGVAPTAMLGALYGAFAVFAGWQRRAGADCGCFGTSGTPVTAVHVWLDAALAGAALGAAVVPGPTLTALVLGTPVAGVVATVLVIVAATLLRLLLTAAADLRAAVGQLAPDGVT